MQYSHYDDEYYLLMRENNSNYPLIKIDEARYSSWRDSGVFENPFALYNDGYLYPLTAANPIPKTPEIVDYHCSPSAFSLRVIEQVTQMGIEGTQWFPAYIHHDGVSHYDYVIMHTYHEIECMDKEKSSFKQWDEDTFEVKKLVLNETVLDAIPLEERLTFLLEESTSMHLFHKSIVDEIMKHNPKGCVFIKSKDWGIGSAFD